MIIKIKSFKKPEFRNLLNYMLNDENRLYNKKNRSFLIKHNLRGRSIDKLVTQFTENEKFRKRKRKDSVILTHEIISFHKDDSEHITIKKLEEIAREYINKRNINGLYLAVPHFDKEHYHIHICASGIDYRVGKSLRMSKAGFQKLKRDIQKYQVQRFPELSNSLVEHDKKSKARTSEQEYQQKLRTGRVSKKEAIIKTLDACLESSHSKIEFFQNLKNTGLKTYVRGGKITGVLKDNMKFRFSRLGFSEERLAKLDLIESRELEISEVRKNKGQFIIRNR